MENLKRSQTIAGNYARGLVYLDELWTENEEMRRALDMARAAASTNVLVLVTGESGTGKNLLAQAIHNNSPRAKKPFVMVNCSAIPESLLESELFGHEKGAFTGAESKRAGRFAEAEGGTLVLDEIGDMSPQAQAKVLHAIEYKQFTPVGGSGTARADVRIIAMTNRHLEEMVEEGSFRQDLFYRLNELTIHVPPLRARREDIPSLLERALGECNAKFGKSVREVDPLARNFMLRYDWPGNVRELFAVIKRAVTLCSGDTLTLQDLGLDVKFAAEADSDDGSGNSLALSTIERRHVEYVLRLAGYHKGKTCELLEISRPTLERKIQAYHIEIPGK